VWGLGSLAQSRTAGDDRQDEGIERDQAVQSDVKAGSKADAADVTTHLREQMADRTVECAVLERQTPGSSKYRTVKVDEMTSLLSKELTS
jgi:proteasome alpha subunit